MEGRDKKIGFYKKDGTKLTDPIYESVSDFEQGMAIVKSGGKYGYIDKKEKKSPPCIRRPGSLRTVWQP